MATPFEEFVNNELPKRPWMPVPISGSLTPGKVMQATGIGMELEERTIIGESMTYVVGDDPATSDFQSIQAAIDAIPQGVASINRPWTIKLNPSSSSTFYDQTQPIVINVGTTKMTGLVIQHVQDIDWNNTTGYATINFKPADDATVKKSFFHIINDGSGTNFSLTLRNVNCQYLISATNLFSRCNSSEFSMICFKKGISTAQVFIRIEKALLSIIDMDPATLVKDLYICRLDTDGIIGGIDFNLYSNQSTVINQKTSSALSTVTGINTILPFHEGCTQSGVVTILESIFGLSPQSNTAKTFIEFRPSSNFVAITITKSRFNISFLIASMPNVNMTVLKISGSYYSNPVFEDNILLLSSGYIVAFDVSKITIIDATNTNYAIISTKRTDVRTTVLTLANKLTLFALRGGVAESTYDNLKSTKIESGTASIKINGIMDDQIYSDGIRRDEKHLFDATTRSNGKRFITQSPLPPVAPQPGDLWLVTEEQY